MLADELESVRKDLLEKMWTFAAQHNDTIFDPYGTVRLRYMGRALARFRHARARRPTARNDLISGARNLSFMPRSEGKDETGKAS